MSTSRTFRPFRRLPTEIRLMVYRNCSETDLIQLTRTNCHFRNEVLDHACGEVILDGTAKDVNNKLRKLLLAPVAAGRFRSIASAARILTIHTRYAWSPSYGYWFVSPAPGLASNMVSFLGDASCLQVFTLNLYGLDQENLHRYATLGFLPETLKSLRLYGNDDSLNAIMKGLRKHQLQSLALKGLSSYSLLGTLLEEQKLSEIELGHTTVDPFLCSLDMACKLPALLTIESLSITVPVNHNHILKSLRHHQGRLTYLSIAVRSLPDDAELTRLNNLYFGKAKNLKYLVLKIVEYLIPKFPLSAAIMAERFSDAGIRTKTVRDLNEIAWPMLSRVTGEYARSQA